jgi:hypothetical protein
MTTTRSQILAKLQKRPDIVRELVHRFGSTLDVQSAFMRKGYDIRESDIYNLLPGWQRKKGEEE